ncbi:hypothetical protein DFH28DRAFT_928106 [Melampsora americana]|nr:hypothetical protein DFH28DRAFT_928106 [Melampsora americana]
MPKIELLTITCLDLKPIGLKVPTLAKLPDLNFSSQGSILLGKLSGLEQKSIVTVDVQKSDIRIGCLKLCLLHSWYCPYFKKGRIPEVFLTWTSFCTIPTLVLGIKQGSSYLEKHIEYAGENSFQTTPDFGHISSIFSDQEDVIFKNPFNIHGYLLVDTNCR